MPTSPTTPPTATGISVVPNRVTGASTFSADADTYMSEINPMITSQNDVTDWIEDTATEVYDNAVEAAASATAAEGYAEASELSSLAAQSASNYVGVWSSLTGAFTAGNTVFHDDATWMAKVNIPDVAADEPGVTSNWYQVSNPLIATQKTYFDAGTGTYSREAVNTYLARYSAGNQTYTINSSTFKAGDKIFISKLGNFAGVLTITVSTGLIYLPDTTSNATQDLDVIGTICLEFEGANWYARAT